MRLCVYLIAPTPAAETDLRRGVLQGRRAPVACKISPPTTGEFEEHSPACCVLRALAIPQAANCKKQRR